MVKTSKIMNYSVSHDENSSPKIHRASIVDNNEDIHFPKNSGRGSTYHLAYMIKNKMYHLKKILGYVLILNTVLDVASAKNSVTELVILGRKLHEIKDRS